MAQRGGAPQVPLLTTSAPTWSAMAHAIQSWAPPVATAPAQHTMLEPATLINGAPQLSASILPGDGMLQEQAYVFACPSQGAAAAFQVVDVAQAANLVQGLSTHYAHSLAQDRQRVYTECLQTVHAAAPQSTPADVLQGLRSCNALRAPSHAHPR